MAIFRGLDVPARKINQNTMPLEFRHYRGKENHGGDWVPASGYRHAAADTTIEPTAINKTVKVGDEERVLPSPIFVNTPCTIISKDGRVATIETPIAGFEHLFRVQEDRQGIPSSQHSSNALPTFSEPGQARSPGAPLPAHGRHNHVSQQPHRALRNASNTLKGRSIPQSAKRRPLKRGRPGSIAEGPSQPRLARGASDDDENQNDEAEKEIVTETSFSFRMGDIDGLKKFFHHRIDELTMKPVRGMVTTWIKQLEPRRQGGYGPYHRKLPSEMPKDATPPWWPQNVEYIEPAHLDKTGLLELAVEVMLQHRSVPIDEVKRNCLRGWTEKLRSIAQFAVDNTPEEHFSSSKNIVFSRLMKERAVNSILPSLFEVSQSYEDYIQQHVLWNYTNDEDIPKGKTLTWQYIARPPKQTSQRRRVRTTKTVRASKDESDIDAHDEASGDDTEVDETMERLSNKNNSNNNSNNNMLRKATKQAVRNDLATQQPIFQASTPVVVAANSAMPQPNMFLDSAQSTPRSSFSQSMDGLHLDEDVKGGILATHQSQEQQARFFGQSMQYTPAGYINDTFHPMQRSYTFSNTPHSSFAPYPTSNYIDPTQLSYYNDNYAFQMTSSSSSGPSIAASDMAFSYAVDGSLLPASVGISDDSAHASASFNGLPNDFDFEGPVPQQQFRGGRLIPHQRQ